MPEADITPEILELILRTSRVKGCSDVYALAPRGHRVGIYFQQRRATLLAAAIRSRLDRDKLKTARIAVIGGGVSGLTFLLAIQNEGAEEAFLYEAGEDIISRGAAASHRLVHPNYNRWPMLGSMDAFTSLPLLNWFASSADKVVGQLRDQIRSDYSDLLSDRVKLGFKVSEVQQRSAEFENPLRVKFKAPAGEKPADFKIVVIAAGYGDEASTTFGFGDYWTLDHGNWDRDEHSRPCTVYGTGDGAIIDLVRACARDPEKAWLMPLGLIARLRPSSATTIRNDRNTNVAPRAAQFSPIEKMIQAHEEAIRCIAWPSARHHEAVCDSYTQEEERFYRGCIQKIKQKDGSFLNFLRDLLKPVASSTLRPVLVGEYTNPFEPTSAPINKLLLAYLLEHDHITYLCKNRSMQAAELRAWRKSPDTVRNAKITICRYGAPKNFPISTGVKPPSGIKVITAAGGTAETSSEAELIDALSGMTGGEYVYFDAMPHPLTKARYGMDQDGLTHETRRRNGAILYKFASEHLKAKNVTFKAATKDVGPKWVVLTEMSDEEITLRLQEIGGLDGNFFGAPIVVTRPTIAAEIES